MNKRELDILKKFTLYEQVRVFSYMPNFFFEIEGKASLRKNGDFMVSFDDGCVIFNIGNNVNFSYFDEKVMMTFSEFYVDIFGVNGIINKLLIFSIVKSES
jgi:hypothetical protein